jgi:class 3 adenylate cyclase
MVSRELARRVRVFRCGAYAGFAAIPVVLASGVEWAAPLVLLTVALLALPVLYEVLERRLAGVERLENLLTPLLVAAAGLPLVPGLTMLAALLAGTLARCGRTALLPALVCLGCGWFAGVGLGVAPAIGSTVVADVMAVLLLIGVALPLAALGHQETLRQYRRRQRLQIESQTWQLLAQFLPPDLDAQLADGDHAPQRRWLTVGAMDLVDFAALVERLPAEDLLIVLDDLYATLAELAAAHGGALHKFLGDGALLCFGTRTTVTRRAGAAQAAGMLTALAAAIADLNAGWRATGIGVELACRAAAASGFCTFGAIGRGPRRDFTVIGSPVNLACRLQALAPVGGVVVDGATADLLGMPAPERVSVRGFTRPVRVRSLRNAAAVDADQARL